MPNVIGCLQDIKWKPYWTSEKRPVMSRCLVKLSLLKDLKILLIIGRRLIGRYLPGSDLCPSFLKTGTTDEDSKQEEKQDSPSIYCIAY